MMKMAKQFAAASLAFTLAASTSVLAANNPATVTLETEFGQSPVLAWSWGATNSGTAQSGGGGGAGKASIQDMAFTRLTDAQSPDFVWKLVTGRHLQPVTITQGSLKFTLADVVVSSYSVGSPNDPGEPQTENITLNFRQITYTVDGTSICWDVSLSERC